MYPEGDHEDGTTLVAKPATETERTVVEVGEVPYFPDALPQLIERNGRIVEVIFPSYENELPSGVDPIQIEFLQDLNRYHLLGAIGPTGLRRAIWYYGSNNRSLQIAQSEGVHYTSIVGSIQFAIERGQRLLRRVDPLLVETKYSDLKRLMAGKIITHKEGEGNGKRYGELMKKDEGFRKSVSRRVSAAQLRRRDREAKERAEMAN